MIDQIGPNQAMGDVVALKGSRPRHFVDPSAADQGTPSFSDMLKEGLADVNTKQQIFADLSQQALVDPESVDPHDITIAMAESNLSLNIAKNVLDRVLRAYREITTLR